MLTLGQQDEKEEEKRKKYLQKQEKLDKLVIQ